MQSIYVASRGNSAEQQTSAAKAALHDLLQLVEEQVKSQVVHRPDEDGDLHQVSASSYNPTQESSSIMPAAMHFTQPPQILHGNQRPQQHLTPVGGWVMHQPTPPAPFSPSSYTPTSPSASTALTFPMPTFPSPEFNPSLSLGKSHLVALEGAHARRAFMTTRMARRYNL